MLNSCAGNQLNWHARWVSSEPLVLVGQKSLLTSDWLALLQESLDNLIMEGDNIVSAARKAIIRHDYSAVLTIFPILKHLKQMKPEFDQVLQVSTVGVKTIVWVGFSGEFWMKWLQWLCTKQCHLCPSAQLHPSLPALLLSVMLGQHLSAGVVSPLSWLGDGLSTLLCNIHNHCSV